MSITNSDRMSAAELRCLTESIGLTQRDISRILDVNERGVRRWMSGDAPIPVGVKASVREWVARYEQLLDELDGVAAGDLVSYRTNSDMWTARPDLMPFPADLHRHAVGETLRGLLPSQALDARVRFGSVA